MKNKCAASKVEVLQNFIKNLPPKQRLAVQACFSASRLQDSRSMRYTTQWIYECFLMRVKSKKLYSQIRRDKILILPSPRTLARYMKHIKATYGFQSYVFKGLKTKTAAMSKMDRRGLLKIYLLILSFYLFVTLFILYYFIYLLQEFLQ